MTRYIVIGAGATGAVLAAQLHASGTEYVLAGRGAGIRQIAEHGLAFTTPAGTAIVPLRTAGSPEEVDLDEGDVLVVTAKTQDVEAVASQWAYRPVRFADRVGTAAELPVVTVQNGLDAERILLRRFAHVYSGSVLIPARYTSLGSVVLGSSPVVGVITLGGYPTGIGRYAPGIAEDLRSAGYVVQLSADVTRWKVAKLLHSVKNALEILTGEPDEKARVGELLVDEARQVFAAAGLEAADTTTERTESLEGFGVHAGSGIVAGQQSTWQSFARKAGSSEIDYLNGEVVLLGRLHGVPTPYNQAAEQLLGASLVEGELPGIRTVDQLVGLASEVSRSRDQPVGARLR